ADLNAGSGDVIVSAVQSGIIDASATAAVEATGAASGKTKSVALAGVIATNAVFGAARAAIDSREGGPASNIVAGNVSVSASSMSGIAARADVEAVSRGTAFGVTLAFNTIGVE